MRREATCSRGPSASTAARSTWSWAGRPRCRSSCRSRSLRERRRPGRWRRDGSFVELTSREAALYLLEVEAVHLHDLRPAALATHDPHRGGRNLERRGEQAYERLVRAPTLWRSRHASLPARAVAPDELRPSRAGRDRDA